MWMKKELSGLYLLSSFVFGVYCCFLEQIMGEGKPPDLEVYFL
ncbi:hypothetical protein NSU08_35265 [Paenibacillus sp. FSL H7-0331]